MFFKEEIKLQKVKPTQSLKYLCQKSKQCEQETAAIRNKTVKSMDKKDVRTVAYRYLQNKAGENSTFWIGLSWAIIAVVSAYVFFPSELIQNSNEEMTPEQRYIFFIAIIFQSFPLYALANVPPNVCNTLRYKETVKACEQWLGSHLNQQEIQKIKGLNYNPNGWFKLNSLLDKKKIPPAIENDIPGYFK